jgi:hypothetical protein
MSVRQLLDDEVMKHAIPALRLNAPLYRARGDFNWNLLLVDLDQCSNESRTTCSPSQRSIDLDRTIANAGSVPSNHAFADAFL